MYGFWNMGGWSPVSISIVIRLVLPISSLFFEKTSGKSLHNSSNCCMVSSITSLLCSFTFLCALTSTGEQMKSDFGGTGKNPFFFGTQFLYHSTLVTSSTSKTSFLLSSFSAKATTFPLGI